MGTEGLRSLALTRGDREFSNSPKKPLEKRRKKFDISPDKLFRDTDSEKILKNKSFVGTEQAGTRG